MAPGPHNSHAQTALRRLSSTLMTIFKTFSSKLCHSDILYLWVSFIFALILDTCKPKTYASSDQFSLDQIAFPFPLDVCLQTYLEEFMISPRSLPL